MAALWMAGWLALMLVMAVAGRETTRELNVFQIMEVRSVIGFTLLLPIIYRAGGFKAVATKRLPQHLARNGVHYFAQLGWFYALTLIGIGQVVAIEFTMPIWTALLAATFLSERMTVWKIAAIALGIVGVVMIVRPATGEINPGQLIALGAAIGFSISMILAKSLTRTESALSILFWMIVVQMVVGLLPTLYVWTWPSQPPSGDGSSSSGSAAHSRTIASPARSATRMQPSWCRWTFCGCRSPRLSAGCCIRSDSTPGPCSARR
ncbi:drug/metabolite transporter (DMT)-like permease [Bradyrhizobium japonicum]